MPTVEGIRMDCFQPLPPEEIERAARLCAAAFPRFGNWESANEDDGEHFGPAIWGIYEVRVDKFETRRFYVTFQAYNSNWRGDLTIGQHAFMWTSADYGDAYLAGTKDCASVEEAITSLQADVSSLCAAFLGEPLTQQARLEDGGIPPGGGPE